KSSPPSSHSTKLGRDNFRHAKRFLTTQDRTLNHFYGVLKMTHGTRTSAGVGAPWCPTIEKLYRAARRASYKAIDSKPDTIKSPIHGLTRFFPCPNQPSAITS